MSKRNIVILVVVACVVACGLTLWLSLMALIINKASKGTTNTALSEKDRASLEASRDKMCEYVAELREAGAFTKVQSATSEDVTHAYVDHAFYALTVDDKKKALGAVAGCYINLEKKNQLGLVIIMDGYSGRRIGTYSMALGLELD